MVALEVAKRVGPEGSVVGLDHSPGMLAVARSGAKKAGLNKILFDQADAEQPDYEPASFDRLFCGSALVLMSDMTAVLRRWREFLKPGGTIAFDTPAKPFGFSQRVYEAALRHGVELSYGDVADTPEKCRALLAASGFKVVTVRKAFANTAAIAINDMIDMYENRMDHPAWRKLKIADPQVQRAIKNYFIRSSVADAVNGCVPNDMALMFTTGQRNSADVSGINRNGVA